MRTVVTFQLGCSPTSGGSQELTVVAKNGKFSHSHYFVRYADGYTRRDFFPTCYQSAASVAEEVRDMCHGKWVESALKRVGCNV